MPPPTAAKPKKKNAKPSLRTGITRMLKAKKKAALRDGRPYFEPAHENYCLRGQALVGAARWLKEVAFPHYHWAGAMADAPRRSPDAPAPTPGRSGASRGTVVDEQLTYWGLDVHHRLPTRMHVWTRRIIIALRNWGYRPVTAQCVVTHRGLGTAIDLVLQNVEGKLVFVEVKTGYSRIWETARDKLREPLQHLPNCPLIHSVLQLALGVYMYKAQYPAHGSGPRGFGEAFVLRVNESEVAKYPLPDWALPAVETLLQHHRPQ